MRPMWQEDDGLRARPALTDPVRDNRLPGPRRGAPCGFRYFGKHLPVTFPGARP